MTVRLKTKDFPEGGAGSIVGVYGGDELNSNHAQLRECARVQIGLGIYCGDVRVCCLEDAYLPPILGGPSLAAKTREVLDANARREGNHWIVKSTKDALAIRRFVRKQILRAFLRKPSAFSKWLRETRAVLLEQGANELRDRIAELLNPDW